MKRVIAFLISRVGWMAVPLLLQKPTPTAVDFFILIMLVAAMLDAELSLCWGHRP